MANAQQASTVLPALGIGTEQVDASGAFRLFDAICMKTAPDFANAPAQIARMPFVFDAKSGDYKHTGLDLIVTLKKRRCQVGFSSKVEPKALGRFLAEQVVSKSNAKFRFIAQDRDTGDTSGPGPANTYFSYWQWGIKNGRHRYFVELRS